MAARALSATARKVLAALLKGAVLSSYRYADAPDHPWNVVETLAGRGITEGQYLFGVQPSVLHSLLQADYIRVGATVTYGVRTKKTGQHMQLTEAGQQMAQQVAQAGQES